MTTSAYSPFQVELPPGTSFCRPEGLCKVHDGLYPATMTEEKLKSIISEFVSFGTSEHFVDHCSAINCTRTTFSYHDPRPILISKMHQAIARIPKGRTFDVAMVFLHCLRYGHAAAFLYGGCCSQLNPILREYPKGIFRKSPLERNGMYSPQMETIVFLVAIPNAKCYQGSTREHVFCPSPGLQLPIGLLQYELAPHNELQSITQNEGLCKVHSGLLGITRVELSSLIDDFVGFAFSETFHDFCTGCDFSEPEFHYRPPKPQLLERFCSSVSALAQSFTVDIGMVFHGTPQANIEPILASGLDPALRNRQGHGIGEYFGKNPRVSMRYCMHGKEMLVFLVVTSFSQQTSSGMLVVSENNHQLPIGTLTFRGA